MLSGDPVVVKEEPDDDHPRTPAVNVEPPADDNGEDEKSEDLAGKMSTIWRPNLGRLRASVAEMEGSESEEEEKDATKKGVKRKRAPYTKGPCEHGVKYRSNCKVCSACPHGKRRSLCKECGGGSICVHGRERSKCKECGGSGICVHGRQRSKCKECGGGSICVHGRVRSQCKECGGSGICVHGCRRSQCKECGGSQICVHGRIRSRCKECKK